MKPTVVTPRFHWARRLGDWLQQRACLLGLHADVDRDEPGWPKMRVCLGCGRIADPEPVDGVGPPDDQRGRER